MLQTEFKHTTETSITADPGLDIEEFQEQFGKKLGMPESMPQAKTIERLVGDLIPNTPENQESINFLLYQVDLHNPRSLVAAQLIVQMFACHQLCTKMLKKAGEETWPEGAEKWVNTSIKLARSFRAGLETLAKVQRNGEQRITIERVNVEKEANAIIGNVCSGRGAANYEG